MNFTVEQARKYAGLTQSDMAEKLHIDRGTYSKIEKDVSRATIAQIACISAATGIPVSNLFLPTNSTKVEL